jgi:two-component system sensor kinase FixL
MAERMFGFRAAEVVGGDVSALLLPPGRERHPGSLRRYLKTRLPRLIGFSRVANARRKDGGKFTLRLTIGEVNLPTERLFTGVLQNLTEDVIDGRRRRESEAKPNEMASRLAHEVTQPLTAIASYIDGAMSLLRAGDPAGALRAMNRVVEQTERAGEIIRQLRAQAKKSDDPRPPVKAGTRVIREVLAHAR